MAYGFDPDRLRKRQELSQLGIDPYPYKYTEPASVLSVLAQAQTYTESGKDLAFSVILAGRLWACRPMGQVTFMDLRDSTGKIQIYFSRKRFSDCQWHQLTLLDLGDILGVEGTLFYTRSGQLSVDVFAFTVLAKAVVKIEIGKETEDKIYNRLADPEVKYRERYIHWILNDEDRKRIRVRSLIVAALRRRMEEDEFLEVLTPTIEFVYGGAEARPFRTSIWALGSRNAYLRISPELYLKRYIVAGFNRVFTICQAFRNEGMDRRHNPEFTTLEWYEAFTDYHDQMNRFERLIAGVCEDIHGTTRIHYQGTMIDFAPPWRRLTVIEAIREFSEIDPDTKSLEELLAELQRRHFDIPQQPSWGTALMALFEGLCEQHLIQPTLILDFPVEISPLTKTKRGDIRLVERFEPYVCGMEIGNSYSELTDPVEQLHRFEAQRTSSGNKEGYESHPIDVDFIKAIGCGMPPTGGLGLGIDRLVMLLTDCSSIRDVIPFPMVNPSV